MGEELKIGKGDCVTSKRRDLKAIKQFETSGGFCCYSCFLFVSQMFKEISIE